MYKKVFLDANILIDINDTSRDPVKLALKIVDYFVKNEAKIYTSCDLITTIYYILSKKSKQEALEAIERISQFCEIIEFSNKEVQQTCELMKTNPKFKDLEDTLQYILAQKMGCDLILSNDTNFASETIELLSIKDCLYKLK